MKLLNITNAYKTNPDKFNEMMAILNGPEENKSDDEDAGLSLNLEKKKKPNGNKRDMVEEYRRANELIYSAIFECVSKDCHKFFTDIKFGDGVNAWKALLEHYQKSSSSSMRKLYNKLFNIKQKSNEDIDDYIFRMHDRTQDLHDINADPLNEDIQLTILLKGLQPVFKGLICQFNWFGFFE